MDITKEASEQTLTLNYQGRKTSRAGSEQRRKTILEAALRIVVREGVRGVRHRAVASEANVPLSATTYYFKDISDLITDTFTLFVEMATEKDRSFIDQSRAQLSDAIHRLRTQPESRASVIQEVVDRVIVYLREQILDNRDYLLAEQAFWLECLRNDNLKPIAQKHTDFMVADLCTFFVEVGSKAPESDATLLMQIIHAAEHEALLEPAGVFNEEDIRRAVSRGIQHLVMGIFVPPLTR